MGRRELRISRFKRMREPKRVYFRAYSGALLGSGFESNVEWRFRSPTETLVSTIPNCVAKRSPTSWDREQGVHSIVEKE